MSDKSMSKYFSALDLIVFANIFESIALGCNALNDSNKDILSATHTVPAVILTTVKLSYVFNINLSINKPNTIIMRESLTFWHNFQNFLDSIF